MTRVPPCPRCGETELVSRDAGCGACGWYVGSPDPPPWSARVGIPLLMIGVAVMVAVLLALAIFDPH